ncbi:MAG: orotate phosphoribosyltransferase [Ignavibacteriales bacterium]|jgi:orotate phosphoribosyltransferase|nr:orotate phosphoribosyltransferase [Ignavibacteriales bacterium]MBK8663328.1 orotate phosphoribosyltransferase [Ignavibacteriales bacterium]MBP7542066.1 orotate phosphoribosyltransferase [Ignavibacteriaceae bacterium]MBP9122052.1 orotate phosphoribosyltransferase [Ignavibacteriaceae bacterium]
MNKNELAIKIFDTAHLTGQFLLRSGKISNEYFDKYRFEADPVLLDAIAEQMVNLIPEGTEVLAGLEMGGIPLATVLSLKTGLPVIFVRKEAKKYGTCKVAEGGEFAGKKVCIIEDVVTTGGQINLSAVDLRDEGAVVDSVLCVILREPKAYENLGEKGLGLIPLFTMEEIKQFKEIN